MSNPDQQFFQSAFSVDNIIFGFDEGDLKVLLIKRGNEPYKDHWALPGDLVYPDEDLDAAAERILEQLTGLKNVFLEQVKTFGKVGRHPRGRVITVAYFSLIKISRYQVTAASFAQKAQWIPVQEAQGLAFDHDVILKTCLLKLKELIQYRPLGFELLPPKFTLSQLQHLYEAILGTELDKRNFRKKILSMHLLADCEEIQSGVAHRPARLFRFDRRQYEQFQSGGFNFDIKIGRPRTHSDTAG